MTFSNAYANITKALNKRKDAMKTKNIKHYIDLGIQVIANLAEIAIWAFSGYVLLTNFTNQLVIFSGLFLVIMAGIKLTMIAVKSFK